MVTSILALTGLRMGSTAHHGMTTLEGYGRFTDYLRVPVHED
jgi:hypothetical protein